MKANDFYNEVLKSELCPNDFETIYKNFQNYQRDALKALKEFHRVCEKNLIPYQLAFGSLLGIVRDSGQIPWDYDIDVLVPYSAKDQLISALAQDLDDKFYYYCPENNEHCRHVIMRLAPKGYKSEVLHVDVFYYIGTPESKIERKKLQKKIKKISRNHFLKLVNPREEAAGNVSYFVKLLIGKLSVFFSSIENLRNKYDELCQRYPVKENGVCIEADSFAEYYEMPSKYLTDIISVETEIGKFQVSKYYRDLLAIWYNDYMAIPPLKNRIEEILNVMSRFEYFENTR